MAIFALVLTLYMFLKSVQTGSLLWCLGASLSYFYTAASWGGYVLVPNLLAIYMICLFVTGSAPSISRIIFHIVFTHENL